jgi:protein transport protein SEC61 subunit gamma-like protein
VDKGRKKGYRENFGDRFRRVKLVFLMKLNLREKIKDYIRVIKVNKKPSKEKFFETLKICVVGIGILGIIGLLFYLISMLLGL